MLSQSIALPLALAASLASSAAAFKAPVLHDHHLSTRHTNNYHGKVARGWAAGAERRQQGRMQRKVRRGEGAMLLTVADNSTEASTSKSSGETYTSTAIWWLQDGWAGACGTDISADALQVALPLSLYPDASVKSSLCGTTVKVTAPSSGKSIDAVVVGASERNDYTSFTQAAFTALEGDLEAGELAISFTLADGASAPASSSSSKEAPASTSTSATKEKAAAATTTTVVEAAKSPAATAKEAALNLAQQKAKTTTTTWSAPAATASSSSSADDESEDDWVCDEEDDSTTATTSQASSYVAPTAWAERKSQQTQKLAAAAAAPTTTTTTTSEWVAPSSSSSSSSAAAAQTSTSSSSSAAGSDGVADTSGSTSLLSQAGIKGFLGLNSNSIVSWYHTNSGQDSTNGNSWCGFKYNDALPGFAPSLKTMLNNFGGDYETAAKAYCGLEAIVTLPNGKSATLYIADAFDDTWVRTPASIDVIYDAFSNLFGSQTNNKNDVIQGATWKFTGNRNDKYKFKSTTSIS
ncbi:hypothetical protein JCM8115_005798 [Rhodotorula mucilaginosa]